MEIIRMILVLPLLLLCIGCAARTSELKQDMSLADLSETEALIIGRAAASVDGEELRCFWFHCALGIRNLESGDKDWTNEIGPFFVRRLIAGTYEISEFQTDLSEVPAAFNYKHRHSIPVHKQFAVQPGEVIYIGSLYIDIPSRTGEKGIGRKLLEFVLPRTATSEVMPQLEVENEIEQAGTMLRVLYPNIRADIIVRLME